MSKSKVGQIVSIYFDTEAIYGVQILSVPCATGDCFTVKNETGVIYYVQQYNYMVVEKEV
jgi:hypothetical protein